MGGGRGRGETTSVADCSVELFGVMETDVMGGGRGRGETTSVADCSVELFGVVETDVMGGGRGRGIPSSPSSLLLLNSISEKKIVYVMSV